MKAEVNQRL